MAPTEGKTHQQSADAKEMASNSETLAELVARLEGRDPTAEARLLELYGRPVRILLDRHTGGRPEAEDLYQDTFSVALQKLRHGELREAEKLPGFLARIARNLAIEHYRKTARRKTEPDSDALGEVPAAATSQLGEALARERSARVRQVLRELGNPRDREILFRFYIAEEDKDAIAADLGLSSLQFNRVLHRARQRYKALWQRAPASATAGEVMVVLLGLAISLLAVSLPMWGGPIRG